MTTPQKVIQSIDQNPVPAPTPQAPKASPAGAPHTAMARMIVTRAPMMTACHADIRSTGSRTSSSTIGTSATSVLPRVECAGFSGWTNDPAAAAARGFATEIRDTGAWSIGRHLPEGHPPRLSIAHYEAKIAHCPLDTVYGRAPGAGSRACRGPAT